MPENSSPDLERFVTAQEPVYAKALAELRAGRKRSHWMWFVFPQIDTLGRTSTAKYYGIKSRAEARAYLAHPVLGTRLRECAEALLAVNSRSASEIFDYPDDLKLQSSMSLFARMDGPESMFTQVLGKYFDGQLDDATLRWLE